MTARGVLAAGAVALLAAGAVACTPATDDEPDTIALTATPVPEATPTPEPSPEPSPTPEATPTPTPEEERDPTDADRARFVAGYEPDGVSGMRQVAFDITGDGIREVVFVLVADAEQRSRVDVAAWAGTRYEIVTQDLGGPADRIEDLRISDITADGRTEIVVEQMFAASAHSASLWQVTPSASLERLVGHGDCFDGSHTYGDTSVQVFAQQDDRPAEVRADCEEEGLPQDLWPTLVYQWEDGAYRCDHRVTGGVRTDCEE